MSHPPVGKPPSCQYILPCEYENKPRSLPQSFIQSCAQASGITVEAVMEADLEGAGAEPTRGLQALTTVPQTLQGALNWSWR